MQYGNALDIINAGFPNATTSEIDEIVWGRTPWPFAKVSAKELYQVSARFYRAQKKHIRLCDFCDRIATGNGLCEIHKKVWAEVNERNGKVQYVE